MDSLADKSKQKAPDIPKRKNISEEPSESGSSDSSESSDSDSSSSDSTRERKKRKKGKARKMKKRGKKHKKSKQRTQFWQRVAEPWQVVKRYKSVLEIFKRGNSMADSFRKYGVDRNTIVQSAAIAELAIAAPNKYSEIVDMLGKREKLSSITLKCQEVIMLDENIAHKIHTMKNDGMLLPIKKD
ncbi:putative coiled-coil domain-containing protein 106-like [Triplophysa rosa]|uniref:Coiled-coil domain-containing protein 106-like n=2 Tax=Triplophysa rosa TaxID=992332 RepID=A0A9W7WF04_TRIRA|nr:putative coiled-coil domain-containing protein 106-like [Triplophysa rosa]